MIVSRMLRLGAFWYQNNEKSQRGATSGRAKVASLPPRIILDVQNPRTSSLSFIPLTLTMTLLY